MTNTKTPEEIQAEKLANMAANVTDETIETVETERPQQTGDFEVSENDLISQYEKLKNENAGAGNIGQLKLAYELAYNVGMVNIEGEWWAIDDNEALYLAGSTDEVLKKYLPNYTMPPELTFVEAFALINFQRIAIGRELKQKMKAKKAEENKKSESQ